MASVWKRCTHDGITRETGRNGVKAHDCTRGMWYWRVEGPPDPRTGKRRQHNGKAKRKADAEGDARDMEQRLARGQVADDQGLTVAEYLTRWIQSGTWKPTTLRDYRGNVDAYLIPNLGRVRLTDLRRSHIAEMIRTLADEGKSGHVVSKAHRTLRSALSDAVEDELITVNPALGTFRDIPLRDRASAGITLEVAQVVRFLDAPQDDPLWSLVVVGVFTGLRRGELIGLPWCDVALVGDRVDDLPGVTVRQTVVEDTGPQACPECERGHKGRLIQRSTRRRHGAKSAASTGRWVYLPAPAVDAITRHAIAQEAWKVEAREAFTDHGLVWCDRDGGPMLPTTVTRRVADMFAAAGLEGVTPKALRRGAASMLANEGGLPAEIVAKLLGQAAEQVTREHYIRPLRTTIARAVDVIAGQVAAPSDTGARSA